jgi:class 3 adenylate cyclase/tetratricopeptide (TPR) repeat protein
LEKALPQRRLKHLSDVGAWLERQGLGQYADLFEENDIDLEVLVDLSEDDLRELSVSFGHRKRLLKAIGLLRSEHAGGTFDAPVRAQTTSTGLPAGERRQVTVLFCDMVGSTAMTTAADDPEDMFELIADYHAACSEAIEDFGGYVARLVGDGVLAYFGYPQALEGEAERATRAALALRAAVQELGVKRRTKLSTRIGIDTGLTVIGDFIAQGSSEADAAVGDTPNRAARLQGLAEPDQIVISHNTRRLLGSLFDLDDLGLQDLKGFSEKISAYLVKHEAENASRFTSFSHADDRPLIGRTKELEMLLGLWRKAAAGQGQTVLVSGEPGVGKSHLIQSLRRALVKEAATLLVYECSPFYTNSAFQVLASQLARAAGLQRADTAEQKLEKLEKLLVPGIPPRQAVPLLGFLCGVPTDHRYPRLDMKPEERKAAILDMLTSQLEGLCQLGPVLTIVEDAHWVDPSSEEMLADQIDRALGLPHLIVVSHRQGLEPALLKHAQVTRLKLDQLGRESAEALISQIAGDPLPPAVQQQIWEKSDGVPLFIEEITKSVLESGLLDQEAEPSGIQVLPEFAIPDTLQDSLMARLDRLGPVKEVVQYAAVLGRSFSADTLQAMMGVGARQMERSLSELVNSELLYTRGQAPNETYVFRHTLLQETAYSAMLRGRRQMLHRLAAKAIEEVRPDTVERTPEILSYHWREAGEFGIAYPFAMQAGERALARYANTEARVRFTEAADAAAELDYGIRMEAEALVRRASVPSEKAAVLGDLEDLSAIRDAVETLGDASLLAEIDFRSGWLHYVLGNFESAILDATQSYERAETTPGAAVVAADAGNLLARIHAIQGAPRLAIRFARRNAAQMAALGNTLEQAEITSVLAFSYGISGEFGMAKAAADEAVRLADSLKQLPTQAACAFNRGVVLGWWGRIEEAEPDFERAIHLSYEANDLFRVYVAHGWRGQALLQSHELAAAEVDLDRCLMLAGQIGTSFHYGAFKAYRAQLDLVRGKPALEECRAAVALAEGQPWAQSIALRVLGETLIGSDPERAELVLQEALALQNGRECWYDEAWTLLAIGKLMRASHRFDEAEIVLTKARNALEKMEAGAGLAALSEIVQC